MKNDLYFEQHLKNTCDLIIKHIKNVMIFQKNIKKPLGWHSRFIENLLHPEQVLIYKGTSKTIFNNKEPSSIKKRKEHIVPMTYLLNTLWDLIETEQLSDEEASTILYQNLGIAYISEDEAKNLDKHLKTTMPQDWDIKTADPLDRLKTTGIILVDNDGNEIKTLKSSKFIRPEER